MVTEIIVLCLIPFLVIFGLLAAVIGGAVVCDVTNRLFGGRPSGIFNNAPEPPAMMQPIKVPYAELPEYVDAEVLPEQRRLSAAR